MGAFAQTLCEYDRVQYLEKGILRQKKDRELMNVNLQKNSYRNKPTNVEPYSSKNSQHCRTINGTEDDLS